MITLPVPLTEATKSALSGTRTADDGNSVNTADFALLFAEQLISHLPALPGRETRLAADLLQPEEETLLPHDTDTAAEALRVTTPDGLLPLPADLPLAAQNALLPEPLPEPLADPEKEEDPHPALQHLLALLPQTPATEHRQRAGASPPSGLSLSGDRHHAPAVSFPTTSLPEEQPADDNTTSKAAPAPFSNTQRTTLQSDSSHRSPLPVPAIATAPTSGTDEAPLPSPAIGLASGPTATAHPLSGGSPPAHAAAVHTPQPPLLRAPLGSPEWQQHLEQHLLVFTRQGQQSAELRLHPQELGALQISLKVDDQQAQLHVVSANSQVRAALEAALPYLRIALAENGIQLGHSSVGSDTPAEWQAPQQREQHDRQAALTPYDQEPEESEAASPSHSSSRMGGRLSGSVDIFA